ncbi:phage coat protein [Salmonella enterica subsp. enterica serovar Rubislaw]|nr:phage coat protein [Salmonella enterica subsp. enterica serovar Rubislaw]
MFALLGIPALIGFLGWLLGTVIVYIGKYITKQVLITAALIALFLGLLISVNAVFLSLLSDIAAVLPSSVAEGISMIMPSNALPCFYAVLSARAAMFIFSVKDRIISYIQGGAS